MDSRSDLLAELKREHRELDEAIERLRSRPYLLPDEELEVAKMKKRKLAKKDEIFRLEDAIESGVEVRAESA